MTLEEALKQTTNRVGKERNLKIRDRRLNRKLIHLFNFQDLFNRDPDDRRDNILRRIVIRIKKFLEDQGIEFPVMNWESIMTWLYENWSAILRVVMSLVILI